MTEDDKKALEGLFLNSQAFLPPRFFYDSLGGLLFEAITRLEEYTPTKDELSIFQSRIREIKEALPSDICLVDLGAGNCSKAEKVLPEVCPKIFLAVDLPSQFFRNSVKRLKNSLSNQKIYALEKDFTSGLFLSEIAQIVGDTIYNLDKVLFFPGSTIGNYSPEDAKNFLMSIDHDSIIIGVDLIKSEREMINAYDDSLGVTAAFNKNALLNANTLLGTDFEVKNWVHKAIFNSSESRIEMHLMAKCTQSINSPVGKRVFTEGESIHTENSYKYSPESFKNLLSNSGYDDIQNFLHPSNRYGVFVAKRNKQS